ncbi:Hypothetical predicted protein [Paramuricea clavata]|uniref:Uncharacterized protein n=1 Tax=Paramuricea clavata TaxID=317549 RepID=A0A7D9DKL7_PARCT|nr:Hypothetical predicted protein [Paramuricea clavata]
MYNQGSDKETINMSSTTPYPQPDNQDAPMTPPGYPALQRHTSEGGLYPPPQPSEGVFPFPQPSGGAYPPSQPSKGAYPPPQPSGGGYPPPGAYTSFPVQQQPTNTVHNTNTTVVIQQQPAAMVVQGPRGWSTGMCACFDECGVCLVGLCSCLFCLPFIECQVSGAARECCCVGICCPIALRTKIRTRHNIQGDIVEDCCAIACCYYCAMCQMQRELNTHGI